MKKLHLLTLSIGILLAKPLSAGDENSKELEIGKEYLSVSESLKNKKVKLIEIVGLTFEKTLPSSNIEIHRIVKQRIENHQNKDLSTQALNAHPRKSNSLENFFTKLPEEIKKPVYYVQLSNQPDEKHYLDKQFLKEVKD